MNTQPKYPTKGPGDLTGPGDPQNEPESTGSVLDCPNETGTWLDEHMNDEILCGATEILGDYLASLRDGYAEAKLHREMMALADKCEQAIIAAEQAEREANDEMRGWYGRKRA